MKIVKPIALAEEIDESNELIGLSAISAEKYLKGIYYLYWGNEKQLS